LKLRGAKLDHVSNIVQDIYELDIYNSLITEITPISQAEYDKYENKKGSLSPELIESLIEKPNQGIDKSFYEEDIRNCIIFNYEFDSFKKDFNSYATVIGEIVFQIEFRIKEKIIVDEPAEDRKIIPTEKIQAKRAAVLNKPRASGEYLPEYNIIDFFSGIALLVIAAVFFLVLFFVFLKIWKYALVIAVIIAIIWLVGYLGKQLLKVVFAIFSWMIVLAFISLASIWFSVQKKDAATENDAENYEDICVIDTILPEETQNKSTDSVQTDTAKTKYILNTLSWTDYQNNRYSFKYKLLTTDFKKARQFRSHLFGNDWTHIYKGLYVYDKNMLSDIYEKYDSLKTGFNSPDFARLIVSSIQEVPYTWILPESCYDAPNKAAIIRSGNKCLGNVMNYGVQSPTEFMANQKGDCDTKTLILYTILKHFNFDVCIFTSVVYEHALLGINIPVVGKYKVFRGKKYYFWETTVKGMDIGQMVPGYSNLSFWDVAL